MSSSQSFSVVDRQESFSIEFNTPLSNAQKQSFRVIVKKLNSLLHGDITFNEEENFIHLTSDLATEREAIVSLFREMETLLKKSRYVTARNIRSLAEGYFPKVDQPLPPQEEPAPQIHKDNSFVSPYRPASILLHAYRQLEKSYLGYAKVHTWTDMPHITSHNDEYKNAATTTLRELQVAYTRGELNEDSIKRIIATNVPRQPDYSNGVIAQGLSSQTLARMSGNIGQSLRQKLSFPHNPLESSGAFRFHETVFIPTLSKHQETTLKSVLSTIRQSVPVSISYSNSNNEISLRGSSLEDVRLLKSAFENFSESMLDNTVNTPSWEESYIPISVQIEQHLISPLPNTSETVHHNDFSLFRSEPSRVVTHKILNLTEIDGVNLHLLSSHLLSFKQGSEFPFSGLEAFYSFAKGALNEEELPCMRLQIPVFSTTDNYGDQKLQAFLERVIRDVANDFNSGKFRLLDKEIVDRTVLRHTHILRNAPAIIPQKESSKLSAEDASSLLRLEQLSHNALLEIVTSLFENNDDRTSIKNIAKLLNVNSETPELHSALFIRLETLIEHPKHGGKLAKDGELYKKPELYEGRLEFEVFPKTKKREHLVAYPKRWNEARYGRIPFVILTNEQIAEHALEEGDTFSSQTSYHEGKVLSFFIHSDSVVHAATLKAPRHSTEQSYGQISTNLKLPKNNIWTGVVTEQDGVQYFTPSLEEGKRYRVDPSAQIETGAIIKAYVSPKKGDVRHIMGEFGNVSERHSWSTISALEAGLDLEFPEGILDGVDLSIPEPDQYRTDLRHIPFITIDPDTAKDYDDAVYEEDTKDGGKILMVAIADVDHYVKKNTALDKEATKRGNTTYLPGLTIPMLPEELSNGVCSLREGEDRAALVATIHIDPHGNITSYKFEDAVIHSRARLTYDQAQDVIEGKASHLSDDLIARISGLQELSEILGREESLRGKLVLDTAEQQVDINTEGEYDFRLEKHNEAHKLIERCMIASNICAVKFLKDHDAPLLVRAHGYPNEKTLAEFSPRLEECGITLPDETLGIKVRIEDILRQAKALESSDDRNEVIHLMIRSQARAEYKDVETPHFALQLEDYTHETSPIRRDVDRHVHYLIKSILDKEHGVIDQSELNRRFKAFKKTSASIAENASKTERRSEEIQRNVETRHKVAWLKENIGRPFNATVSHIDAGNLQVTITGHKIKTFIPADEIPHATPEDMPYQRGDAIKVTPTEANPITGNLKFAISTRHNTSNKPHTRYKPFAPANDTTVQAGKISEKKKSIRDVYFHAAIKSINGPFLSIELLHDNEITGRVRVPEPDPDSNATPVTYQEGEVVRVATTSADIEKGKLRFALVQKPV